MRRYSVSVPVSISFRSAYDTHDFGYAHQVEYEAQTVLEGVTVNISISGESGSIELRGIRAKSEVEAVQRSQELVTTGSNLCSLEIQLQNSNPHYGHPRVDWEPRLIDVTPSDQWPREELSITAKQEIDSSVFPRRLEKVSRCRDVSFLLSACAASYYSVDYRTKFFNAFLVLEFLEQRYAASIETTRLVEDSLLEVVDEAVRGVLVTLEQDVINRVVSAVRSTLTRMTSESRALKLTRVLNDVFGIQLLEYLREEVAVDVEFVRDLIEKRNAFFHARPVPADRYVASADLKRLTDLTVILATHVVQKLIDEEVALPSTNK